MRIKSAKKQYAEALVQLELISSLPKADRYEVMMERAHTLLARVLQVHHEADAFSAKYGGL